MTGRLERFADMSVLVVDDNATNIALLAALLGDEGLCRIATQTDPRRVAGMLPHVDPDLVLLDLHMPHLDGLAVLAQINTFAAGTYLPVLILTADVNHEARDRALADGARDFLTKPFDGTEATLRIANLLETRQLYSSLRRSTRAVPGGDAGDPDARQATRRSVQRLLSEGGILSALQPVVALDTLAVVGHEALSRFPLPHSRGPAGWFSDAFEVGLGVELEWLAATQALAYLEGAAPDEFLAVNMSPASVLQLRDRDVCPPERRASVVIELTEHAPIEDYRAVHRALEPMRRAGARIAADDLGAGYAGFRHLLALEPDIIKLDISLISGVERNAGQRALTRAMVAFAADVGATVLAEGVETAAELEALRELGVVWAQGFYLGRPAPAPQGRRRSATSTR